MVLTFSCGYAFRNGRARQGETFKINGFLVVFYIKIMTFDLDDCVESHVRVTYRWPYVVVLKPFSNI